LVTGHTGFKGAWLSLWLQEIGAKVYGISIPGCDSEEHLSKLQLAAIGIEVDIRDFGNLNKAVTDIQPDIVFHLAAQSLVRRSYKNPRETWDTNVVGTLNILEAAKNARSVQAVVVATTDKVYENKNWVYGYRENDQLGGYDPYSASKAATEILIASYRNSFMNDLQMRVATARSGNVLGGGDWSEDRIIPDLVRSLQTKTPLLVRNPLATRPWQHVLDPLAGYLLLGQNLLQKEPVSTAWNFGPNAEGNRTVADLLNSAKSNWAELHWQQDTNPQPHEASFLFLNTDKARTELHWQPVWPFERTVKETIAWYKAYLKNRSLITREQLERYQQDALAQGAIGVEISHILDAHCWLLFDSL
jgi:CDP-glucose 4,6-dehydratase